MGSLFSPLAQLVLGVVFAPAGRPGKESLHRLLVGLLGLAAAALISSVAVVILVFSAVIWIMPPGSSALEVNLLTAALLLAVSVLIWLFTSRGQTPHEILDEALEADDHAPLRNLSRSAHRVLNAFERGWQSR